ncbi:hypothetical protein B0H11DRAFT_810765 [Mycena galericulata]|nr:hypothetical protein B0H11DRAFT_998672 [Mycena galericulata]KAJ7432388.1 hypothetical protein B0H11DRAFT_810765 [Mycena galericulata]
MTRARRDFKIWILAALLACPAARRSAAPPAVDVPREGLRRPLPGLRASRTGIYIGSSDRIAHMHTARLPPHPSTSSRADPPQRSRLSLPVCSHSRSRSSISVLLSRSRSFHPPGLPPHPAPLSSSFASLFVPIYVR